MNQYDFTLEPDFKEYYLRYCKKDPTRAAGGSYTTGWKAAGDLQRAVAHQSHPLKKLWALKSTQQIDIGKAQPDRNRLVPITLFKRGPSLVEGKQADQLESGSPLGVAEVYGIFARYLGLEGDWMQTPIAVLPVEQLTRTADGSERSTLTCYFPSSRTGVWAVYTRLWEFYDRSGAPGAFLTSGLSRQYPSASILGIQVWPLFVALVMGLKRYVGYESRKFQTGQGS